MFNQVTLLGNLTRDISIQTTQAGMTIAKTAIATSRKFKTNGEKREEVMFIDITFFGNSADIANQFLKKGSKTLIAGRLVFEQWRDQQGNKRSKHTVVVENMQLLDSRTDSNAQANHHGHDRSDQDQTTGRYQPQTNEDQTPNIDISDDEIPFF